MVRQTPLRAGFQSAATKKGELRSYCTALLQTLGVIVNQRERMFPQNSEFEYTSVLSTLKQPIAIGIARFCLSVTQPILEVITNKFRVKSGRPSKKGTRTARLNHPRGNRAWKYTAQWVITRRTTTPPFPCSSPAAASGPSSSGSWPSSGPPSSFLFPYSSLFPYCFGAWACLFASPGSTAASGLYFPPAWR